MTTVTGQFYRRSQEQLKACILAVLLLLAAGAKVQAGEFGSISGTVLDVNGAGLAGANVLLVGTSAGSASDLDGHFSLLHLEPGAYKLRISMLGYGTTVVENIEVVVGLRTPVEVVLKPQAIAGEEIIVRAKRPLIRADATSKTTTLGAKDIEKYPVLDLNEILATQANISVLSGTPSAKSGYDIRGIDDIRMRGGRNNEVALLIDGVKVSNPIFGGFATRLNNKAIKQLTVLAGGFSARYGNALSGVVNITTQEAREKWTGSLRYSSTQPFGLKELTNEVGQAQNRQNFQMTLGGPLAKNLSFFASGEVGLSAGDIYRYDNIIWDDYRSFREDSNGDGILDSTIVLPSSAEIIAGLRNGMPLDSLHGRLSSDWDEVRGPDGRRINPLDSFKGWKRFGWNNQLNGFMKLTWQPKPVLKFAFSLLSDQQFRQRNNRNGFYVYDMQGQTVQMLNSNKQTLRMTHTLSKKTFYTVHVSRFYSQRQTRILKDHDDPWASPSWRFGADSNNLKEPDDYIPYRSEDAIKDPFENGAFYLVADNRWYDGDASTNLEFRSEVTSEFRPGQEIQLGLQYNYIDLEYYAWQNISRTDPFPTEYHRYPQEAGAFVQLKSELDFLVLNIGTRLDWSDSGGRFWENPFDPMAQQVGGTDTLEFNPLLDSDAHLKWSPRVGLAYPLTEASVLHFNFGHFYQFPNYRDLYRASNVREISITQGNILGNPRLEPEKSVQYEIGLQQSFGESIALKVNLWTKETTNQVGSLIVPAYSDPGGDNPFQYAVFVNNNFGSARGLDVSLERRLNHGIGATLHYTWSRSRVLQATSWDGFWSGDTEQKGARREELSPWDQTHVIRLQLQLVPAVFVTQKFNAFVKNTVLSFQFLVESGRPYTPTIIGDAVVEKNSQRWPMFKRLDLKVSRSGQLAGQNYRLGLEARNVLDWDNVLTGYSRTGSATDPGTSSWHTLSSTYWDSRNNNNFGMARNLHFFVELDF